MKNKLASIIMAFGILLIPAIQSCKKYVDGPGISFRSRTERVANTWRVENYKKNGNDLTSFVSGYEETYSKSGAYTYSNGLSDGFGAWMFQNNDDEIKINRNDKNDIRVLHILRLEENNFWFYFIEDNDRHEYHMISK